MNITTINKYGIKSLSLPSKVAGQYWLYDYVKEGPASQLVQVEGINGEWLIKSNRYYSICDKQGDEHKSIVVTPHELLYVRNEIGDRTVILAEQMTDDRKDFTKYLIENDCSIQIGRTEDNDICYDDKSVSSVHATMTCISGQWFIHDEESTNGVYVNGARVSETNLVYGDTVFIMGLKIIVGRNFLALNNPDGKVKVAESMPLFPITEPSLIDDDYESTYVEPEHFFRSPRFKRDIEVEQYTIDSPPQSPITDDLPWPLVMGSSFAMGMMSIVTLTVAISTNNYTSMAMGGSMLIGTLLIPIITKVYEKRRKKKKEAVRQEKYKKYLGNMSAEIDSACKEQEVILRENFVPIEECEQRIIEKRRNLWERSPEQNDFLRIRVGTGDVPFEGEINFQAKRFTLDEDNLQDELYNTFSETRYLHNVPVTYSLFDNYISGVIGERRTVVDFAKVMIIQLCSLFSPDEVKMIFLYDPNEQRDFEFVKWLPHSWDDDDSIRFIATDNNELKELSSYFDNLIAARSEMNENDIKDERPFYVFFSLDRNLAERAEFLKKIYAKHSYINMSVVTLYDELKYLPKECSIVIELVDSKNGLLYDKDDITGAKTQFLPDMSLYNSPETLSVKLSNMHLDSITSSYSLPAMVTFLELYGVGKVEHLNASIRWKENDPTKSLEAPIGVDTMGDTFMLDLHEKFHGPHGLVAGMTGSGKSEFIITYILSLAVNYHPYEVAFILIDYKGGGMAKSFENLPHTAGIITNLDGGAIKRSLVSIESELKRRQALFAEASKLIGVSNIDIYKYQKLYREGTVKEPLQHLFIISDEFAELKTQQPEFMTQLVSAARIGRSLGVHLILATQKPSGVVDDQIWSNSRFRVCLKVQERADSMDMLKRPDAASLVDTGRFYLQVGYNELFELGQSAWAGATYYPSDTVLKEKDDNVIVIDRDGNQIKNVKTNSRRALLKNDTKQLDAITDYLRQTADEEGIKIRSLWLEPIPAVILRDKIAQEYNLSSERFVLNPLIGMYDDPARQRQEVLRLPISEDGNVVVYGAAGCGKTTFINVLLYSLIHEHTPDEVNIFILDFASETLQAFSKAPHVGNVILSYEAEKITNLFNMLKDEITKRKKLFADYGGDIKSYYASGKSIESIVVVISNFSAFTETYEEKEAAVAYLSREGTKYGIYFVLTSLGTGGVRFRLLQNFKQLITLQLNDENDYSTIVGKTEGLFPSKFKGRGLLRKDALYEFQTASITEDEVPFNFIKQDCQKLAEEWDGNRARKVPVLPEHVDIDFMSEANDMSKDGKFPIGVEKSTLDIHYYSFVTKYINLVISAGYEYRDFINAMCQLIEKNTSIRPIIIDPVKAISVKESSVSRSTKECEEAIDGLFDIVLYRNNTYKEAIENGTQCAEFEQKYVVISSLNVLLSNIDDEHMQKLNLILEKGSNEYNLSIILGDQVKSFTQISYEKWYKTNLSTADGIWIGDGITEQYLIKASKTTNEMHQAIGPEFGYSFVNGKCTKLKVLGINKGED